MIQTDRAEALRQIAELLLLIGEREAAHAVFAELAPTDPLSAAKGEATRSLLDGHLGQALMLARRAAARYPNDLEASLLAAHCLAEMGRLADARAQLVLTTTQHPGSIVAWLQLIEWTARAGDPQATLQVIQSALAQCDEAALLWQALARWHVKQDAPQPAIEAYRQALLRDPGNRDLWLESAALLLEVTTPRSAALWLEVAVQGPLAHDPGVHVACARAWTTNGDEAQAAAVLARLGAV